VDKLDIERFETQLKFIYEIDKVKLVLRKSRLFDGSRQENDAEHSWTICIMAILLQEYSNTKIDILKVIKMLLIHDVVEIYAGDTFLYSKERDNAYINEEIAARKIFSLLPEDQFTEYLELWNEFELKETDEAKYASVFDRIEPILQNYKNEGYIWKEYNITKEQIMRKNEHIEEGSKKIWNYIKGIIDKSIELGYLKE